MLSKEQIDGIWETFAGDDGFVRQTQRMEFAQAIDVALRAQADARPIYQLRRADGAWIDQTEQSYKNNQQHCAIDTRIVYTHPEASAPGLSEADRNVIESAIREAELSCQYALAEDLRAILTHASAATVGEPTSKWEDPRVQQVYEILCRNDNAPVGEHWEGFLACARALEPMVRDGELLEKLRQKLECDGFGYWLPEICLKEIPPEVEGVGNPPTQEEFREALDAAMSAATVGEASDSVPDMRDSLYFALVVAEDQLRRISKLLYGDHVFVDKGRTVEIFADMAKDALNGYRQQGEHCMCVACKDGVIHASDCAVHNAPAFPNGSCDCEAAQQQAEPGADERALEAENAAFSEASKTALTLDVSARHGYIWNAALLFAAHGESQ